MVLEHKDFSGKDDYDKKKIFINKIKDEVDSKKLKSLKNEISIFLNEINQIKRLNHTEELFQFIISIIYIKINKQEIDNLFKITDWDNFKGKEFEEEFWKPNLKESFKWFLFEECFNSKDSKIKYKLQSFSGIKFYIKERISMDFFISIYKKEDNELINGFI